MNQYQQIDMLRTKHLPHLLRNFPVTASGENDTSNKEFIASIDAVKYLNFASKHNSDCSTTLAFLACPFAIKLQNVCKAK